MKKYKILYIDHGAKLVGGGQANTLSLIRCLDKGRFEPQIVSSKENSFTGQARNSGIGVDLVSFPTCLTETYRNNVGLSPLRYISYLVGLLSVVYRLAMYITHNRIDLIHPCDNISRIAGGVAARLTGIPAVCQITDDLEDTVINRMLRSFIFWGMDYILPVSDKVSEFFLNVPRYRDKVKTIYTGIDLDYFNSNINAMEVREELGLSREDLVVGIVGLLIPIKGHRELFRALAKIKETSTASIRCLVVGDGPDRAELEKLVIELNISNEVLFTGFRKDVARVIASLDIIAVPSHTEASSRVVLEAGAFGIPAVGTKVGGIPEMIQDGTTGLLVNFGDIKALADAIIALFDTPRRKTMGASARLRVQELFCNKNITLQIQTLYLSLLQKKQSVNI